MNLPPGFRLSFEDRASQEDRDAIGNALDAYSREFLGDTGFSRVCFFVRNGRGEIMAALVGSTYAGWLFVADLWVHAELRRRGVGRELLARAERRAVELGCHSVRLDRFSFQSPLAWAFLAGHSCDAFFQLVDGLLRPRTRVPPIPPSQPPLGVTPTLTFVRTRAVGEPPRSATAAPSERQKQLESGRENSDNAMVN